MKILLADDEKHARERLRDLLLELGSDIEIVGEATTGLETLKLSQGLKPDVLLLDIDMPGLDGLSCACELAKTENPPAIIFTTAYDDFALQAFEVAAYDYLLKPIREERLKRALARVKKPSFSDLARIQAQIPQPTRDYICVHRSGDVYLIPVKDILYFQADQKYTTVKTATSEALIEDSLKSLEAEFSGRFIRIHRNALVSVNAIEGLEKIGWGSYRIKLKALTQQLEISRRCLSSVRALLRQLGEN